MTPLITNPNLALKALLVNIVVVGGLKSCSCFNNVKGMLHEFSSLQRTPVTSNPGNLATRARSERYENVHWRQYRL
jgi:hypothetical protein